MLESFRKGQRWLTLIFVASIGIVFIFFFGSGGGGLGSSTPTGNAIIELDELQLTSRDFGRVQRETENRLRQQLGDSFDEVGASRIVDSQALSQMINGVVLSAAAEDLGLYVTTDEVKRIVSESPSFIDADGKFSPSAFANFAEGEYGTQRAFIRSFTRSLLGQKLIQLLSSQTTLTDAEIDLITRYQLDEVRIAYVAIDGTTLPEGEVLSDDVIGDWADANEDDLRSTFNERALSLATPEQVRARHILVQVGAEASAEDVANAQSRAEAARARINLGEDFATVAGDLSEDVGTASLGGDLGSFARGDNDPALDEAAFSLAVGEVSEVIRSDYGFHVVRVDEKVDAQTADWKTSRLDLAREGAAKDRARELADERAADLSESVTAGTSLEDAAREMGLTLERPPSLNRRPDGFVPGLGAAESLLTAAFTLEAGTSSAEIFDVEGRQILLQVLERSDADDEAVASQRIELRDQILAQKQNQMIESWLTDYRRQLEASGRLLINAELALGRS